MRCNLSKCCHFTAPEKSHTQTHTSAPARAEKRVCHPFLRMDFQYVSQRPIGSERSNVCKNISHRVTPPPGWSPPTSRFGMFSLHMCPSAYFRYNDLLSYLLSKNRSGFFFSTNIFAQTTAPHWIFPVNCSGNPWNARIQRGWRWAVFKDPVTVRFSYSNAFFFFFLPVRCLAFEKSSTQPKWINALSRGHVID